MISLSLSSNFMALLNLVESLWLMPNIVNSKPGFSDKARVGSINTALRPVLLYARRVYPLKKTHQLPSNQ